MRISPLILTVLALTACPKPDDGEDANELVCGDAVDNDEDGLTDCADDDCATSADCVDALASSCPDATVALQALDMVVANSGYAACLAADPANSEAAFGVALTQFLMLGDWSATAQGLEWCSQSADVTEQMFGTNGVIPAIDAAYNGSADLSVRYDPEDGGTQTTLTSLLDPQLILTEIWEGRDDDYLAISVQQTIGGGGTLRLRIPLDDVYDDGNNTPLETGRAYDVGRLSENSNVTFRAACEEPGSRCDGFAQSGEPDGTITFSSFSTEDGATVSFDIDALFPAHCDDTPCLGAHTVFGAVTDTLNDMPDVEDVPFGNVDPACSQSGVRCDYDTEFLTVIADVCDVSSFDAARGMVGDMAVEMDAVADVFELAGADAGLTFTLPATRLFFAHGTRTFNQTDALLIAASMRSAAATARLGAQYNWLDPISSPDDLVSTYDSASYNGNDDECSPYTTTGVSQTALLDAADGHLGTLASDADFGAVRDGLADAFTTAGQAIDSTPTGEGMVSPMTGNTGYSAWLAALEADVAAVVASLEGSDGELPSASSVVLEFDSFFDAPTDRSSLQNDLGVDAFVTLYEGTCRDYVEGEASVGDWIAAGGDFGSIPTSSGSFDFCTSDSECVVDGETCNLTYNECEFTLPLIFNNDAWDSILDEEDTPFFFSEQARTQADEWAY